MGDCTSIDARGLGSADGADGHGTTEKGMKQTHATDASEAVELTRSSRGG